MSSTATPEAEQLRQAEAAYSAGDLETSARLFAGVTRSADKGSAAEAFYGLGMLALATRRQDEASRLFRAATLADPGHANSWYQLGCLAEPHSHEEAIQDLRRALAIDPQHVSASRRLAMLTPPPPQPLTHQRPSAHSGPLPEATHSLASADAPADPQEGIVASFQQRVEQRNRRMLYVWDFRVIRGGLDPISVEMRGYRFDGTLANGDRVRLPRGAKTGKVLHLHSIANLSGNAVVQVTRRPRAILTFLSWVLRAAFILLWLAIAAGIVYFALR
jgi:tetratricopeptide (TPR) repeat protein